MLTIRLQDIPILLETRLKDEFDVIDLTSSRQFFYMNISENELRVFASQLLSC